MLEEFLKSVCAPVRFPLNFYLRPLFCYFFVNVVKLPLHYPEKEIALSESHPCCWAKAKVGQTGLVSTLQFVEDQLNRTHTKACHGMDPEDKDR